MRRLISLTAVFGLLAFGGCGGDDEDSADPAGAGATGVEGASTDQSLTASEFIDASIPDQAEAVEDLVDANPDCAAVDAEPGEQFQVGVAITAAQSPPGTPLEEIVAGQCGG